MSRRLKRRATETDTLRADPKANAVGGTAATIRPFSKEPPLAAKSFRCRLITPIAQVLDEQVTSAVIPAWDGLMGFLPDRAPIVAKLGLGELNLVFADTGKGKAGSRSFLVEDGFAQMVNNKLTILAARAIPTESLTATEAQAELKEAEARKPDPSKNAKVEGDRISADRARARLKVRLAGKSGGRGI